MTPRAIATKWPFGAIAPDFTFDLHEGYTALFGLNGSGKSSILQLIFKTLVNDDGFGIDHVVYIEAERGWLSPTTEVQSQSIADYNRGLAGQFPSQGPSNTLGYHSYRSGFSGDLTKFLLNHKNFSARLRDLDESLLAMGLPVMTLETAQQLHFDDVLAGYQGSGLRFVLPILAALNDPVLEAILIDEPEASLEPVLAKRLRQLLIEKAGRRAIVVASHSHWFIDHERIEANLVVGRGTGAVRADPVRNRRELADLVFKLLGNAPEDLMLPANFLVVEGGSDQVILERVLRLLGDTDGRVKVFSARGIAQVPKAVTVADLVLPLLMTGPYAKSVVALVDQPDTKAHRGAVDKLAAQLQDRLFKLQVASLEEYLPEALYVKAGRDKANCRSALAVAKKQGEASLADYKTVLATEIAAVLAKSDLALIPTIRDAAQRSLDFA